MVAQDKVLWYAEYRGVYGLAELSPALHGYLFTPDGFHESTVIRGTDPALMRFGQVDLADAQQAVDQARAAAERAGRAA